MAGNRNQTSEVPDGGPTKLNTSETTTTEQEKGVNASPYKVNN